MMMICGQDVAVAAWTAAHIPHMAGGAFGPGRAIGVADSAANIVAGVVYHDYQPAFGTMQISMAAASPLWARRGVIRALLSYPFEQLRVEKLWSAIPASNTRALRFNLGIGFEREAVLVRHFGADDAIITRMFRADYIARHGVSRTVH